jgi:hypothetical protein
MKRTILLTTIPERKKNLAPILLLLRTQADEVRVSFNRYKEIPEIAGVTPSLYVNEEKTFIPEDRYVVKHGKHHYGNDWIDKTHYEARKHYKRDRNTKILFAKRPPHGRA